MQNDFSVLSRFDQLCGDFQSVDKVCINSGIPAQAGIQRNGVCRHIGIPGMTFSCYDVRPFSFGKILDSIAFYNTTACPMNWKYDGQPKTIVRKTI